MTIRDTRLFNVGPSVSTLKILSSRVISESISSHPEPPPRQIDSRRLRLQIDHNTWSLSTERLTNTKPINKSREVPLTDKVSYISFIFHVFLLKSLNKNAFQFLIALFSGVMTIHPRREFPTRDPLTSTSGSRLFTSSTI